MKWESVHSGCMEMNAGESHEREITEICSAALLSVRDPHRPNGRDDGSRCGVMCETNRTVCLIATVVLRLSGLAYCCQGTRG